MLQGGANKSDVSRRDITSCSESESWRVITSRKGSVDRYPVIQCVSEPKLYLVILPSAYSYRHPISQWATQYHYAVQWATVPHSHPSCSESVRLILLSRYDAWATLPVMQWATVSQRHPSCSESVGRTVITLWRVSYTARHAVSHRVTASSVMQWVGETHCYHAMTRELVSHTARHAVSQCATPSPVMQWVGEAHCYHVMTREPVSHTASHAVS